MGVTLAGLWTDVILFSATMKRIFFLRLDNILYNYYWGIYLMTVSFSLTFYDGYGIGNYILILKC